MAQHYGSLGIIDPVTITINLNEHVIPRSKFDADNYISDAKKNAKKAKIIISKTRINHILLDTYVSIRNKAKQYYERYKEEEYLEMVKNYDEKINGLNSSDEDTKVISLDEITR
jgi:hypothetical protein